jgi:CDP-diacylglycerol--glycerol-3-phosphate 3-phosphatidyltransferase
MPAGADGRGLRKAVRRWRSAVLKDTRVDTTILDRMAAPAVPATLARIPNALTLGRLLLIPVFVVALAVADGGRSWLAALLFGGAGITDQLDGWLARRWRVESDFGRYADPLADRLLIDAAVILLWLADRLPWAALLLILARDGILIGGYKLVAGRGYEFSVSFLGKAATWILYAALAFVMVTSKGTAWPLVLFWIGLGIAALAALLYGSSAWRQIRR